MCGKCQRENVSCPNSAIEAEIDLNKCNICLSKFQVCKEFEWKRLQLVKICLRAYLRICEG